MFGEKAAYAPQTEQARDEYCGFLGSIVKDNKAIRDVVVWNEPNKEFFWQPQFDASGESAAPAAYEALLAAATTSCTPFAPTSTCSPRRPPRAETTGRTRGATSRTRPSASSRSSGKAYRASGRDRPIFDTLAHHVYGELGGRAAGEAPRGKHDRRGRLRQARRNAAPRVRGHGAARARADLVPRGRLPDDRSRRQGQALHGRRDRRGRHPADRRRREPGRPADRCAPPRGVPAARRRLLQLPALGRAAARGLAVGPLLDRSHAEAVRTGIREAVCGVHASGACGTLHAFTARGAGDSHTREIAVGAVAAAVLGGGAILLVSRRTRRRRISR